ncbi:MAG: DUF4296 domain-containing protein [Bacteroidales bacterium]|jgi:hypothetical protein
MKTKARFVKRVLWLCCAAVLMVTAVSCHIKVKKIPGDDFQWILRDLFMTDLILERDGELSRMADSLLVYPPVLEKHGYTQQEFLVTVDYYTRRPSRFKSLLSRLRTSLNEERKAYTKKQEYLNKQQTYIDSYNNWLKDTLTDRRSMVQKQCLTKLLSITKKDTFSLLEPDYQAPYLRVLPVWEEPRGPGDIPPFLEESVHIQGRKPRTYISKDLPGLSDHKRLRLHVDDTAQEMEEMVLD